MKKLRMETTEIENTRKKTPKKFKKMNDRNSRRKQRPRTAEIRRVRHDKMQDTGVKREI